MTDEEERLQARGLVSTPKDGQHLPQKLALQLHKGSEQYYGGPQPAQRESQHDAVCHLTCRQENEELKLFSNQMGASQGSSLELI